MTTTFDTATRIAETYAALAAFRLDWVYLTHIRAELSDLTREEQDAALMYLYRGGAVETEQGLVAAVIAPDSSRDRNLPEHVAAAFRGNNWIAFQEA